MRFDAAILDVDGVLTRTAAQHERAWKKVFDRVLSQRGDSQRFTHHDYLTHVDGKPRMDGLCAFFRSRGIDIADDEAEALADEKNRTYLQLVDSEGVEVFEDAPRQIRRWRGNGLGVAFVSSSRNAARVLRAAGLDQLCDVLVDGETASERALRGKPDLFREAARILEVEPPKAFVVEDAVNGVEAAANAGFGLVVGLARNGDARALLEHGADRVVRHLDELSDLVEAGTRRGSELPRALPFEATGSRLGTRRPALLIDYDGTLTPIVPHPDDAWMDDAVRGVLEKLSTECRVAIISGRDRADVTRRVAIDTLWYVGSHGFDIASPEGRTFTPLDSETREVRALEEAEARLRDEVGDLPGVIIERKRFGLAAHYRMADEAATRQVTLVVRDIARRSEHLRVRAGERAIELRPNVDWDKGRAVRYVLRLWGIDDRTEVPVYLGDGDTDEDAFQALREDGVTILVGSPRRPTHAQLRLAGPEEVRTFLHHLERWLSRLEERDSWTLRFEGWNPERERLREALCTLGNGYFGTRGAAEESRADRVHYPGTYFAGGYDRITTEVLGELVENENLVNWPNWLPLNFRPEGGEWLALERCEVLELTQELDLEHGELRRQVRLRDRDGRESLVSSRRFVSMQDPHVAGLKWELTPLNWSGPLLIRSSLDGTVQNEGVERYRTLRGQHLVPDGVGHAGSVIWLAVRAQQSRIRVAEAARTTLIGADQAAVDRHADEFEDRVDLTLHLQAVENEPIRVEKIVTLHTSRDHAISNPLSSAFERLEQLGDYDTLRAAHERSWARLWHRYDIRLGEGHEETNRILRLHIFHLLQVASPHVIDRDVGIPARGLHGEAYRGHIFWDELFVFPFLNYSIPELTRELLMYRYRRLDAARWHARNHGWSGAAYPWQSGSSGREENQTLHLNPLSNRWLPDETHLQRHVNAAIAWNVWQYHQVSGDYEFLSFHGAEMLVEIARFWASLATWDRKLERFRIRGVVGPDEFHTRYPGAALPGIDDNAYTNIMASWCLRTAEHALCELGDHRREELMAQLGVSDEDRVRWNRIASGLRVVFHDDHIISQFDGYGELRELDWDAYRERYTDIHRLDRILEAEGDTPNAYKLSKQADVLMLFFLFSADELIEQLRFMGYVFDPMWIPENVDYYIRRTSHGSTLSRVVDSWVLARSDRARSFSLFQEALQSDLSDVQGGTTPEGIHLGAMAGTVDLVKRGYTGAVARDGILWLEPLLPDEMSELQTRFRIRGAWLDVHITHEAVEVAYTAGQAAAARVGLNGHVREVSRGERFRVARNGHV